ncbi:type III secretion system chaperone [Brenneria rubrifaciens]|uniref:DspFAvrF family protein n=1 Tax=Brenneria rubrifaciens TaxID=55213 RepID=A0A4V1FA35_9GAMM|nr:type III secretion system chaperone [Brenneria rubrifaciens]QCR09693.1 DspFAvrF family protein [Brenneria rubrifaciens]
MTHYQRQVERWLQHLAKRYGTSLSLKNGICALCDEEGGEAAVIEMPAQSDSLLLHCQMPVLPEEISEVYARFCLQLNFEMNAMRGCWLALDDYQTLRLCTQYTVNSLDEQTFTALVEGFIQQAKEAGDFLRDALARFNAA